MSSFIQGAMQGVNLASNVVGQQHQWDRQKKLDSLALEDRSRRHSREDAARDRQARLDSLSLEDRDRAYKRQQSQDKRQARLDKQSALDAAERRKREAIQKELYQFNLDNAKDSKKRKHMTDGLEAFYHVIGGDIKGVDEKKLLDSLNVVYEKYINQGDGGKKKIKSITNAKDIDPDQEGFAIGLGVTPENGKEYPAPMTDGRGTDPDEKVKVLDWEDGFDIVTATEAALRDAGHGQTVDQLKRSVQARIMASGGSTTDKLDKEYKLKTKLADKTHTNKLAQIEATKNAKAATSRASSSQMQAIDWLMANYKNPDGTKISPNQAWEKANEVKQNPKKAIIEFVESMSKQQADSAMLNPNAPKRTTDEMVLEATEIVQKIMSQGSTQTSSTLDSGMDEYDAMFEELGIPDNR